jgi:hypothetical protein
MDFVKQYLVQSITYASGNLRLNSNQIETLALFKEMILKSDHLEDDIIKMKKVTEFSTLAIKLHELFSFVAKNSVDISTISEKFKQHSQLLVKEVNLLLYNADHSDFKIIFDKLKQDENKETEDKNIDVNLVPDEEEKEKNPSFTIFEETILKPIKPIDSFLNEICETDNLPDNIDEFIKTMKINSDLSKKNGFEILSGIHSIVSDSLTLIKEGNLKADKETVGSLRACLIVIAALIRGKEVNISDYINKAESFSKKINSIKSRE